MTQRCVFCKRIRIGNRWAYEKPEGIVIHSACPQCIEEEKRKAQKGGLTEDEQIEKAKLEGF
jgi:hypothetical protein